MITLIGSLKGGTGKSTVSFNLAVWLAQQNIDVHLFDLDPQKTLTDALEVRAEWCDEKPLPLEHTAAKLRTIVADEVLVDIGLSDMHAVQTALEVADRIVIPVPPSQADIWSTQRFLKMIKEARKGLDSVPEVLGFINRADTHHAVRESDEAEEALGLLKGITPLSVRLSQRTAFRRSFSEGMGVFELKGNGKATSEFMQLAKRLY